LSCAKNATFINENKCLKIILVIGEKDIIINLKIIFMKEGK